MLLMKERNRSIRSKRILKCDSKGEIERSQKDLNNVEIMYADVLSKENLYEQFESDVKAETKFQLSPVYTDVKEKYLDVTKDSHQNVVYDVITIKEVAKYRPATPPTIVR